MAYSDEHGYSAVDRDQRYLLRFSLIAGVVVALLVLAGSIPSVRDWVWRTFLPQDHALAHAKAPGDADLKNMAEALNGRMRKCSGGQLVVDSRCPDGSAGTLMNLQDPR